VTEIGGIRIYGEADGFRTLTVAEVRAKLRLTLEELASREAP
jgi:hypothetical protein